MVAVLLKEFPDELAKSLDKIAKRNRRSRVQECLIAIEYYVSKNK